MKKVANVRRASTNPVGHIAGISQQALVAAIAQSLLASSKTAQPKRGPVTVDLGTVTLSPNGQSKAGNPKFNARIETPEFTVYVDAYAK